MKIRNYVLSSIVWLTALAAAPLQLGDLAVPAVPVVTGYATKQAFTGTITYPVLSAMGLGNITQFVYGEPLTVTELGDNGWVRVASDQQPIYLAKKLFQAPDWIACDAWVAEKQLHQVSQFIPANLVVSSLLARIYKAPALDAEVVMNASFGSVLQGVQSVNNDVWWQLVLHDGSTAFVQAADVSMLSTLATKPQAELRRLLCSNAQALLGTPYVWGGRSGHDKDNNALLSGCDCSAFINLVYRTIGLVVPRNSVSQHERAQRIAFNAMQPGDMIFFSYYEKCITRVRHVMLYLGNDYFIDVTANDEQSGVFVTSSEDKIGCKISDLEALAISYEKDGKTVTVTAGTFFDDACMLGRLGA